MTKGNKLTAFAAAMSLAFAAGTAAAGTVTSKGEDIVIDTTGGLKMETASGKFSFQLGGRFMWDYNYYDGAFTGGGMPVDERGDAVHHDDLRRARLELKGTAYHDWEYVFAVNFNEGGGNSSINDLGLAYTGWDGHKIFLGRGKEPFGLEELTSSKWISTIERSMFWDSTTVDHQSNYGIRYDGWGGMFTWQLGLFDPEDGDINKTNGSVAFSKTGRITIAPMAEEGQVVHFGLAYSDRAAAEAGKSNLINASPGISDVNKNGDLTNLLTVGSFGTGGGDDESLVGLEALGIFGPASVQFEYFMRDIDGPAGMGDQSVDSWYLLGTYTLTGESRGYKAKSGTPDKVSPKGKYGAIELVAKYDHIEAETGVAGASDPEVDAITVGANWYVNKNVKFALNYTDASSENLVGPGAVDDGGDAVTFRAQYAF